MKELTDIQGALNAPKNQYNSFGRYKYRSCEDILAALKPLLQQHQCTLTISDDICLIGTRYYVKSTATLTAAGGESVTAVAYAREEETKKGMDASQVTGATSSYARKYALNGLFAIDDTHDADALNTGSDGKSAGNKTSSKTADSDEPDTKELFAAYAKPAIEQAGTREDLLKLYNDYPTLHAYKPFMDTMSSRRKALGI